MSSITKSKDHALITRGSRGHPDAILPLEHRPPLESQGLRERGSQGRRSFGQVYQHKPGILTTQKTEAGGFKASLGDVKASLGDYLKIEINTGLVITPGGRVVA